MEGDGWLTTLRGFVEVRDFEECGEGLVGKR